jgi:hypothetical protein
MKRTRLAACRNGGMGVVYVVVDHERGKVVWAAEGKSADTLNAVGLARHHVSRVVIHFGLFGAS